MASRGSMSRSRSTSVEIAGGALLPLVSSLFFGIRPVEPLVIGGVAAGTLMLVVVTTLSVVWPLARRGPSIGAMR